MANLNCSGNTNPLYNGYFSLLFNRGTSQFELLCQRVNLPGISVPSLVQPTTLGTTIPVPSMVAAFADLSVEFIVDENMTNWKSLYSWIRNISNIKDDSSNNLEYYKWHTTATLNIFSEPYTKNGCNTPISVTFVNIVPVSLGGLQFQSDASDTSIQRTTCAFKYSYYTINPDAPSDLS